MRMEEINDTAEDDVNNIIIDFDVIALAVIVGVVWLTVWFVRKHCDD